MDFPIGAPTLFSDRTLGQSTVDAYGWILVAFALAVVIVALAGLATGVFVARRRFWCASAEREVEVSFVETGLPGFRQPVAALSCSVFDQPRAVTCRRDCLNRDVRVKLPMTSLFERRES
jgi:hypothetical protein